MENLRKLSGEELLKLKKAFYFDGVHFRASNNRLISEEKALKLFQDILPGCSKLQFEDLRTYWITEQPKQVSSSEAAVDYFLNILPREEVGDEGSFNHYPLLVDQTTNQSIVYRTAKALVQSTMDYYSPGISHTGTVKAKKSSLEGNVEGEEEDFATVEDWCSSVAYEYNSRIPNKGNISKITIPSVKIEVETFLRRNQKLFFAKVSEELKYDPQVKFDFRQLASALYNKIGDDLLIERGAAVLHSFIRQHKRKILNLPVETPVVLNFCGEGLCGKSTFVRDNLLYIMNQKNCFVETNLVNFLDKFSASLYTYPSIYIDEIAKQLSTLKHTDDLKARITGRNFLTRKISQSAQELIQLRFSMASTSNSSIFDALVDESSGTARRFYEFYFLSKPGGKFKFDFEFLNTCNKNQSLKLWQAVDPYAEDPLDKFRDELEEESIDNKQKGYIETYLKDKGYTTPNLSRIKDISEEISVSKLLSEMNKEKSMMGYKYPIKAIKLINFLSKQSFELKGNQNSLFNLKVVLNNPQKYKSFLDKESVL